MIRTKLDASETSLQKLLSCINMLYSRKGQDSRIESPRNSNADRLELPSEPMQRHTFPSTTQFKNIYPVAQDPQPNMKEELEQIGVPADYVTSQYPNAITIEEINFNAELPAHDLQPEHQNILIQFEKILVLVNSMKQDLEDSNTIRVLKNLKDQENEELVCELEALKECYETKLREAQSKSEDLVAEIERLNQQKSEIESEKDDLTQTIEALKKVNQEQAKLVESLKCEGQDQQVYLSEQISILQINLEQAQAQMLHEKETIKNQAEKIQQLDKKFLAEKSEVESLNFLLQELKDEIQKIRASNSVLEAESRRLQAACEAATR